MANPGAVCGNPRDAASWWLIVDIDARVLRWQREELRVRRRGRRRLAVAFTTGFGGVWRP